jgi:hypothetical protein
MHEDEKFWIQERKFVQIEKGRVITLWSCLFFTFIKVQQKAYIQNTSLIIFGAWTSFS